MTYGVSIYTTSSAPPFGTDRVKKVLDMSNCPLSLPPTFFQENLDLDNIFFLN